MCPKVAGIGQSRPKMNIFGRVAGGFLTSCFGLMTDSAVVDSALVVSALYQMDVPALSYIYAAYDKSGLISNGKE
jgi:hypothetical protein